MKKITTPCRVAILICMLLAYSNIFAQDFNVQHVQNDVGNAGSTTFITPVSSLNSAFVLNNNNRKTHAGPSGAIPTLHGNSLSGAQQLSGLNSIAQYRALGSDASNMRFNASVMEYVGAPGDVNEMIVRGRYAVSLNGTTNSVTQALTGVVNANDCIPFITGIVSDTALQGADTNTAIAYLENGTTLRVEKGSMANNVTVYITVVEFTGSNWTVLHGDSGNVSADTGTVNLTAHSSGTGVATSVTDWGEAVIFTQHRGDNTASNVNSALADNWPVTQPGASNQTVNWTFHSNHDSNGTNRQFVHVLNNPFLKVTRFQDNSNAADESTIDISSAALTNINQAMIVGSSITSGNGRAYARGWRNYYFNSNTQAAHWSHRSGNTMTHEIQIVDFENVKVDPDPDYCASNGQSTDEEYIGRVELNTIDNTSNVGTTSTGYSDFTAISTSLTQNSSYNIRVTPVWTGTIWSQGYSAWIDFNRNGSFDDPGEQVWTQASTTTSPVNANFTIPATAQPGTTRMRVSQRFAGIPTSCESFTFGEVEDYTIEIVQATPEPEINVVGNGQNISDSDNSPSVADDTDYGTTMVGTPVVRTYTIQNLGTADLNLGTITMSGTNGSEFTVTSQPAAIVAPAGTTTFEITFTPSGSGTRNGWLTLPNDDNTENPYNFAVTGIGTYPDPEYTAYYENFDEDNGGWNPVVSFFDAWVWTNSFPTNEMGEGSFWRNNNYDDYNNFSSIVIESPVYDFSGLQNLKLSLDVKYKTQDDQDGMILQYSINGGAYVTLSNQGASSNWYEDIAAAITTEAWNGDGHAASPSFDPHNQFVNARFELVDPIFANQSNVRFRIQFSSDASGVDDGVAFDNFRIEADPSTPLADPTEAPGQVTSNLRLWLKLDAGVAVADGAALTTLEDQAFASTLDKEDAYQMAASAPTYYNNATNNINFNPVMDFDNANSDYMMGKGGFYSQDYFVVVMPDNTVDNGAGKQAVIGGRYNANAFHDDPTGLGFGDMSTRFTDEVISHTVNAYDDTATVPDNDSYGMSFASNTETFSNEVLIINVKTDAAGTSTQIYKNGKLLSNTNATLPSNGTDMNFKEFGNVPFLLGTAREGISGNTSSYLNGRVSEIISYSASNSVADKQKIQSYLGLKYGVTIQGDASGLSDYRLNDVDYVDSQGTVIWNTTSNAGYNYDIAGIGRDDHSELNQKQSKSQNATTDVNGPTSGLLSIGLTDLYDTNNTNITTNTNALTDGAFLVWGNDNADLELAPQSITVNLSAGVTPALTTNVGFTRMQRTWKVVETGGDVETVKVSIPQSAIRNMTPTGDYYMFISDTDTFDLTAEIAVMTDDGSGNFETTYDFDGTKYVTFGFTNDIDVVRAIDFDGSTNYLDMGADLDLNPGAFTVSAWIKRDTGSNGTSLISKRDVGFTEGFDLMITAGGALEMSWINGTTQTITSATTIPTDKWHHIAVVYNGTDADMYIDGVLDRKEALAAPVVTTQSFFVGAAGKTAPSNHYDGQIDEIRIWNTALTVDQLRYIMNQEIEENATFTTGKIIPASVSNNEIGSIAWSSLEAYYPMSEYTFTNTKDASGNNHLGALRNINTVDRQTTPLPYESNGNGAWSTAGTWLNNADVIIPNSLSITDNTTPITWNIVQINNDVTIDTNTNLGREREVLGLIVDSNTLTINGDTATNTGNALTVSHYLKLDGVIDLEGESQLLQSVDSDLDVTSSGRLERDQQGTADTYTYNYWSSPVGVSNTTTNNNSYKVQDVLRDGTQNINFITTGYNGTNTSPIGIANYWIWKFANQPDDDYSAWQHIKTTGDVFAGEGFTMKGPGTGGVTEAQNYVFTGKPNNGDINLTINADNDYLVGNPYPSALDAQQFILDNGSVIGGTGATTGTLYFWEHWGGGSHTLADYQGGYATYNLSGGTPSASQGTNDPDVGTGGTPAKTPGRYIPVSQAFFVVAEGTGGTINFNNGQRVFQKESASSIFFAPDTAGNDNRAATTNNSDTSNEDLRAKFRFGLNSSNAIHRQLLLTVDSNATANIDWGYDGLHNESQMDDMYWMIEDEKFIIQGRDVVASTTVLPIGIHTANDGMNNITIDALENVDPSLDIYVYDKALSIYHDLRASSYEFYLAEGTYLERFEIVFQTGETLGTGDATVEQVDVHYSNASQSIVLLNPTFKTINNIEMFNLLGQSIYKVNQVTATDYAEFKTHTLSTGTYIIKVETEKGILSKKVLVE